MGNKKLEIFDFTKGDRSKIKAQFKEYEPLISVCITHYERPTLLKRVIDSIRIQTYKNIEVVLVDDGSKSDAAIQYLDDISIEFKDRKWQIIRQDNRYAGAARNNAASHAHGEYLLFMDDDNVAMPNEIETFVTAIMNCGADILTCALAPFVGSQPPVHPKSIWPPLGGATGPGLLSNAFGDTNALWKSRVFHSLGGFTEDYGVGQQDWETFANAVLSGYRLDVVPEVLFWYYVNPNGVLRSSDPWANHARTVRTYLRPNPGGLGIAATYAVHLQQIRQMGGMQSSQPSCDELLKEKDEEINALRSEVEKQRSNAAKMDELLKEKDEEINAIINSKSWKLTKPLRLVNKAVKNTKLYVVKSRANNLLITTLLFLYKIYKSLPLSLSTKRRISNIMIRYMPTLSKGIMTVRSTINTDLLSGIPLYPPSDNQKSKKILVINHHIPTPDKDSGSVRLFAILEVLCEANQEVTFLSDVEFSGYTWALDNVEKEIHKYIKLLSNISIKCIFGRENCIDHIIKHGQQYKTVILCYPEICYFYLPLIRYLSPSAQIVYDTVDIHYLRFEREAEIKNDKAVYEKALWYKKIEFANLRSVDKIIAITRDELQLCNKISPNVSSIVVPNIHNIEVCVESIRPPRERQGIMFIGHYFHTPNEDAVIYLVNEILPIVNDILGFKPDVYLLGSSITETVKALKSNQVNPIGYVEDPSSYFNSSRVFVAPLRYGAGMKGKIGQALSYGLPVVTTSIGAEGMFLVNKHNALIADDSSSFAEAIVQLYTDTVLWNKISSNGLSNIVKNFSKESARMNILSLID